MIPISENRDYFCDFSLPNSDEKFYGKFSLLNNEIVGDFYSLPIGVQQISDEEHFGIDVIRDISIVHCEFKNEFNKSIKASLVHFNITTYFIGSITRGTFYARFIAFGEFINDLDSISTDSVQVHPKYINQWTPLTSFKASFSQEFKVSSQDLEPITLYKSNERKVALTVSSNFSLNRGSIKLNDLVLLTLRLNKNILFNNILNEVESIRRLISLCYFETIPIQFFTITEGKKDMVWIQSDNRNYASRRIDYRYTIPFHLKQVDEFDNLFAKWFEMDDNMLLITTKYFETSSNLFVTHVAFQEYVNILERLAGLPEAQEFWSKKINEKAVYS